MADVIPGVTAAYVKHLIGAFGSAGEAWLRRLPSVLDDLSQRWQLELGPPFDLSYDYVIAARRSDGSEAVLKAGVPRDEFERGIEALRVYAGNGACALLEADPKAAAVLLERAMPGEMLSTLAYADDEAATRIGASVMRRLWRPVDAHAVATFRPIRAWLEGAFSRYRGRYARGGPLPEPLVARAEWLSADLLASAESEVLLHGDLHHFNILSAQREPWLCIDPKGVRGDPGYEVGPFLLNPKPDPPGTAALDRRLRILEEELDYDRQRLRDWGFAHAVMSAYWSLEDHGDGWQPAIAAAERLLRV